MVRAIVTLSHNLGLDVVAEGVETPEQLSELRRLGCEYAQGFYFSKPADAETAALLIGAQPWKSGGNGVCSVPTHASHAGRDTVRTKASR
jgi:predicted signal transduction protein with EAL and GGDEF domain